MAKFAALLAVVILLTGSSAWAAPADAAAARSGPAAPTIAPRPATTASNRIEPIEIPPFVAGNARDRAVTLTR